jgi:hypothetical protein
VNAAGRHLPDDGSALGRRMTQLEQRLRETTAARNAGAGWTTLSLTNGWTPASGSWTPPQVRREPATGAVQLAGSILPGALTTGTIIAALPDGMTPAGDLEFRCMGGSPGVMLDVTVTAAGTILVQGTSGTVTRVSLTDIRLPI